METHSQENNQLIKDKKNELQTQEINMKTEIETPHKKEIGSPKYWLSLEQWRNDPEFKKMAEQEFMSSPLNTEETPEEKGWARREFLKLMGASMALTTFGCVRRPVQKIVPYVNRPEEIVPGLANYYSSMFHDGNEGFGLIVKTREGRPIKVEGLPENPSNHGGLSARAHAHVLNLYDPDRATDPMLREGSSFKKTNWEELDKMMVEQLRKGQVALLRPSSHSESFESLVDQFSKTFGAQDFVYDGVDYSGYVKAQSNAYGQSRMPQFYVDKADYILSVGTDFMGTALTPTRFSSQFAKRRKLDQKMNKLVVMEGLMSLTGANADERYQVRPSEYSKRLLELLHEIIVVKKHSKFAKDESIQEALSSYSDKSKETQKIAHDLLENKGRSLVFAGGVHGAQEESLQTLAAFLNHVLGNEGETIDYEFSGPKSFKGSFSQLDNLKEKMDSGKIKTLIINDLNVLYLLPESYGFKKSLSQVETVVYCGDRLDETGDSVKVLAPTHHALENWGDAEFIKGVYSIQQPTIRPLHNTRGFQDTLLSWASKAGNGELSKFETWYDYLKAYWQYHQYAKNKSHPMAKSEFSEFWLSLLQTGVFDTTEKERSKYTSKGEFSKKTFLSATQSVTTMNSPFELDLYLTSGLKEGTLSNVSWLQEFPDPVTKICWDNYVSVAPKTAHDMNFHEGDYADLTVNGKSLKVPVHIQPGQEPHVLGLALGFGKTKAVEVAKGIGVKASDFVTFDNGQLKYAGLSATLKKSSGSKKLANMQSHHSMEGRQIVVEATLNQYKNNPASNIHKHKIFSVWSGHKYPGVKWGMTIDLNACNGCGACMVACQAENNIPVVGEKYVTEGRIMHWIRVDRYYTGQPQDPGVVHMPVACQHCDNAPCETVCPVAATTHNEEGLNEMIYNRCVGTRYCANNCPYKVRRFNWFDYTGVKKPLNLAMNPEVTVRDRGVMEKCTFCHSRIEDEKMKAKNEGRALKDGDVLTACQQSCPTKAIEFGNTNDKDSRVSKSIKEKRAYKLLEEVNAQPATLYLSKVRNVDHLKNTHGGHHGSHGSSESGGH